MPVCHFCGCNFRGDAYRREVQTGSSTQTGVYGRRFGASQTTYRGLRSLCANCAAQHDKDTETRDSQADPFPRRRRHVNMVRAFRGQHQQPCTGPSAHFVDTNLVISGRDGDAVTFPCCADRTGAGHDGGRANVACSGRHRQAPRPPVELPGSPRSAPARASVAKIRISVAE